MSQADYDALVARLRTMRNGASDLRRGINYIESAKCAVLAGDDARVKAALAEVRKADFHLRQAIGALGRELERARP